MVYRNDILKREVTYKNYSGKLQKKFEDFIFDEKKEQLKPSEGQYLDEKCRSIAPITLVTLRRLSKESVINVVLLREITFNDLVQRYNTDIKQSEVYKFFDAQGKNILAHYQEQNSKLISLNAQLEHQVDKLKEEIEKTKCKCDEGGVIV